MTSEKINSFPTAPILPKVKTIRLRIRALDEAGVPMSEWRVSWRLSSRRSRWVGIGTR